MSPLYDRYSSHAIKWLHTSRTQSSTLPTHNTLFGAAERHYPTCPGTCDALLIPRYPCHISYVPEFDQIEDNMFEHASSDNYIPYGRGGAGNMRRQSAIRDAWCKIASQPDQHPLVLISSPEDHYANSKSERRSMSSLSRRSTVSSSSWSLSTSGEHRSSWKRFFKRKDSVEEDPKTEETSS